MIILENVNKTYTTSVPAINGIDLHVQKGEVSLYLVVGKEWFWQININ